MLVTLFDIMTNVSGTAATPEMLNAVFFNLKTYLQRNQLGIIILIVLTDRKK